MGVAADFSKLPNNSVTGSERERISLRIDDLARTLGSPGDWGYDTKLGELVMILRSARGSLEGA